MKNTARLLALTLAAVLTAFSVVSCSPETEPAPSPADELNYVITLKTESGEAGEGVLSLQYPQLDGGASGHDYSHINSLIAAAVREKYDAERLEAEDVGAFNYDLDAAEVTCATNEVFSVYFRGGYYVDGAAHDSIFSYTVNADLQNDRLIPTEEIIGDFSALKESFESGAFSLVYGQETLLDNAGYADMFTAYREDYALYPDVYFTPVSLGVSVELVYALGGFAGFELPLADAAPMLNADCPAVAALMKNAPAADNAEMAVKGE